MPPTAEVSSVTEASAPAVAADQRELGADRGEREGVEHHVHRVEHPAGLGGEERAPLGASVTCSGHSRPSTRRVPRTTAGAVSDMRPDYSDGARGSPAANGEPAAFQAARIAGWWPKGRGEEAVRPVHEAGAGKEHERAGAVHHGDAVVAAEGDCHRAHRAASHAPVHPDARDAGLGAVEHHPVGRGGRGSAAGRRRLWASRPGASGRTSRRPPATSSGWTGTTS